MESKQEHEKKEKEKHSMMLTEMMFSVWLDC